MFVYIYFYIVSVCFPDSILSEEMSSPSLPASPMQPAVPQSDKLKVEDAQQLLRQMGVKRAALQLDALQKELRSLCDPLFDASNVHKIRALRRPAAQVLGESARIRAAARASQDQRMKRYLKKCHRDTSEGVNRDVERILSFDEEVGSPRTKAFLTKMRRQIYKRRLHLMYEEQKLNEGTIHQAIQHERSLVAANRAKRIAAKREQLRWARRKSAAAAAASAKRHRLHKDGNSSDGSRSSSCESDYEAEEVGVGGEASENGNDEEV